MRCFLILLALASAASAYGKDSAAVRLPAVPPDRIIDPSHSERRSREDIEVLIFNQHGVGLMTFQLNRKPVAKLRRREAIRLYLRPARYRFGVVPVFNATLPSTSEINAEVGGEGPQLYRIFKSAGFTSSGGNALYEIALVKQGGRR